MVKIQFETGQIVEFDGNPTQADIEEVAKSFTVQPLTPKSNYTNYNKNDDALTRGLINAGEGVALSVGNLVAGTIGGAAKLAGKAGIPGANKVAGAVENYRQKAFVQPTQASQQTFAGKAGKVVTDVAPYMIPVGGLAANAGKSAVIGFGQSNGDVKSGVAAGVIDAATGGLSKLPGAKSLIGKGVQTLLPGYTSDVVQGVAGQRGEDRTGVNALIPGAGTLFSGVLGAGVKGVKTIQKLKNPQTYIDQIAKDWDVPANAKNVKFDKAKKIEMQAKNKGFDVRQELAQDKVILDKHITDNKYDTTDLVESYRKKAGSGSEYLDKAIKLKTPAVLKEPSKNIYEQAIKSIDPTTTEGDSIIRYLRKEAKLQKPELDFTDLYNKKKYYGSNSNWKMGMPGEGIKEKANAELNKIFKEKLVQKGKEAGIPIDKFLQMQEQQYKVADYLESLNGAKVPLTRMQKIRRGTLKTTGALVGAKGGPYGAVAGFHGGGLIDSLLGDMPKPVRDSILKDYQKATPQVQKQMEQIIADTIAAGKNIEQRMLSGRNSIFPTMDTSGVDIQATQELTDRINQQMRENTLRLPAPTSNAQGVPIPLPGETASAVQNRESYMYRNYPKIQPLGLPAPRIVPPLKPNQTYIGNYSGGDLAKIRQDTGGYLPLNQSSVAIPTTIPNKTVSKKTIKVKLPRKTK